MSVRCGVAALGRSLAVCGRAGARGLLELVYPETCVLCGTDSHEQQWSSAGPAVAGLSWCDGPHLCRVCERTLAARVVWGVLPTSGCAVAGGRPTGPSLVTVLGQWKYHGVRGLAWPLARLLRAAVSAAEIRHGPTDVLVPIALHARRRRRRGFNQAAVLAQLVAAGNDRRVRLDILRRIRATGQQAKLNTEPERQRNLAGAFAARSENRMSGSLRIGLIDDLVTGGTTCDEAVGALGAAGWDVAWVATLGLAMTSQEGNRAPGREIDGRVDTATSEI